MAKSPLITLPRLKELLYYDPETGILTWRISTMTGQHRKVFAARAGAVAGSSASSHGYSVIRLDRKLYLIHRLVWFYMTGTWPADQIDHRNGIRHDNRIANLREATQSLNMENMRRPRSNNKSGFLGVYKRRGRWMTAIRTKGGRIYLGPFDTPEEASIAYLTAKRRFHEGCTL